MFKFEGKQDCSVKANPISAIPGPWTYLFWGKPHYDLDSFSNKLRTYLKLRDLMQIKLYEDSYSSITSFLDSSCLFWGI